jgi:hypothetical protein
MRRSRIRPLGIEPLRIPPLQIEPLRRKPLRIKSPSEVLWGYPRKTARDRRRVFTETQKKQILYQQDNKCAKCHKRLDPRTTQFHHGKPWAYGGRTKVHNGRAMHPNCHQEETYEERLRRTDRR